MTREEQIKEAAHEYIQSDSVAAGNELLAFGDFINGAKWADNHPQWIPVDERLPEKGKDVLVWSSGSDVPMAGYYWHWNWQRKQHMFYVYNDRNMWGNITHWMPIVPPRKEDK